MCPGPSEHTRQAAVLRSAVAQAKTQFDASKTAAVQMDLGTENKSKKGYDEKVPGESFGAFDQIDGARGGGIGDATETGRAAEARDKGTTGIVAPVADAIRTTATPSVPHSQTTSTAKADGDSEASRPSTGNVCSPAIHNMGEDRELQVTQRAREQKQQTEVKPTTAVAAAGVEWRDLRGDTVTALVRQLARYRRALVNSGHPTSFDGQFSFGQYLTA